MKSNNYLGRGIHNNKFLNALTSGKLKPMLMVINDDLELDVQIRNNYLNIYYDGGSIAKVRSENSISFDKNYFYTDKIIPAKKIDRKTKEILTAHRNELICKFKEGNFKGYFDAAKKVMNKWFKANPKAERKEQHQLSIENRYRKSDYTIIDLEYQVSTKSEFACELTNNNGNPKKPRFDIIAVNKHGKLCIIELKKGSGALKGVSGLIEHWDCYKNSIGRQPQPYMNEMKNLLDQKHTFNLINSKVKIKYDEPEFMFAYSYATADIIKEDKKFEEEYKKIKQPIKVIKLPKGSYKLTD